MEIDQTIPFDDPFLGTSGSWGQPYADLWGLEQIRAFDAWPVSQGEGSVVAVVDTGLDRLHPDIAANVWVNPGEDLNGDGRAGPEDENGIDDDANGFVDDLTGFDFANSVDADEDGSYDGPEDISDPDPFDDQGHGTHVSGTIAAVADNGIGIVGVAPRANIMALKGFPEEGSAMESALWRAVLYAAENGATVVNNSWSCGTPCPFNPLAEEVLEIVAALGTVVVTSAGNASTDVVFNVPENTNDVLTIGALGYDERLPGFSNRGWGIDVVAPGGGPNEPSSVRAARRNILSLLSSALDPDDEIFSVGGIYWRNAGTSMASPHVAGAVAVLRSLRADLTPEDVRRLVRLSARDLGSPGHDPIYGAGELDLTALIDAELPDLDLRMEEPKTGTLHDPAKGPVQIRGFAEGGDLDRVEFAVAPGIFGRAFAPLPSPSQEPEGKSPDQTHRSPAATSSGEPRVLVEWDLDDVSDGPYVVRMRGHLRDDRIVDEYLVIGVERVTPILTSDVEFSVGFPVISGRRIVWPVAESDDPGAPFDLAGGVFRTRRSTDHDKDPPSEPRSRVILEQEGSQTDVALDGRNLVWRVREGLDTELGWCRLHRSPPSSKPSPEAVATCAPVSIDLAAGFVAPPFAGGGWLLWQRNEGSERAIEGCRVGRSPQTCVPRPLVEQDGTSWTLRSFDGHRLLLQGAGRIALCTIDPADGLCSPMDITFAPGTPPVTEPIHDGRLLAFSEVTIESRPPAGCLPSEFIPECLPAFTVVVRYRACLLDDANECDSIPISTAAPIDSFAGLEVAGRRIGWSLASDAEEPSIRFCEFQPATRECVEQRLSGSLPRQDGLAIDENRIVWRDARLGETAIWSYALPDLTGRSRANIVAGRWFRVPLRVVRGTSPSLRYEIVAIDGLDPTAAKARIVDPGPVGGRVWLQGWMPAEAEGLHHWRVRAEGEGRLFSEWILELEVAPPPNDAGRKSAWTRRELKRSADGSAKAHMPGR